jgi:transglutaminase-like putative cysteine protease
MKSVRLVLLIQACLLLLASASRAGDFPPVTAEERAVTSVPGEPNAPAVVLFRKGEFLMAGYGVGSGSLTSVLKIQMRVKVLTEEDKSNGELSIGHDDSLRLRNFAGRTVLPDGRVIPVPKDAKFVRKTSRSRKTFVTAVAFPSVEVGAILDYQYELWFDSIFYLHPWYFSEDLPVRYSEIVFKAPLTLQAKGWSRSPQGVKIESETHKQTNGYVVKAWANNVPSLPDDPYGPPYTDLAAQMLLLPSAISNAYAREPLLESWQAACELIGSSYDEVRRRDSGVDRKAFEIAGPARTPREKAEALYRFVRDEIDAGPYVGVVVDSDAHLGKVLSKKEGSRAERALLLQAMLKAVKIDSRLVWAGDRNDGTIDPQLPNPNWFDTVLVMVELDGQRFFLDPTDSSLGFGQLRSGYEGTMALIYDKNKPEEIVLPETPFDQNVRRAEVDLTLDEKGRLAGTGTLRLTGHPAWEKTEWQEDEAKTLQAWKDWLAERYRDFQISDVKVTESPDERKVLLTWALAQREEEVLGDEVSVVPSAPLGPASQPFVQPASSRRSGVVFDYLDRQEVELRLRWPEGWKVESLPKAAAVQSPVGALDASVEVKEAERSLVYRRRMDLTKRTISNTRDYEAVRSLFGDVEKSDAQALVLVRR